VDTKARLAIFAIVENNHSMLSQWRPGGNWYTNGVGLAMLIPPVSIKDHTVAGTSAEMEHMPLT